MKKPANDNDFATGAIKRAAERAINETPEEALERGRRMVERYAKRPDETPEDDEPGISF